MVKIAFNGGRWAEKQAEEEGSPATRIVIIFTFFTFDNIILEDVRHEDNRRE